MWYLDELSLASSIYHECYPANGMETDILRSYPGDAPFLLCFFTVKPEQVYGDHQV